MPQRKTMDRDELSTIIQFAPVPLVVLDRNRCLARVNKLAQSTLNIDSKYCNGDAFSLWISEGSQLVFTKALNHAVRPRAADVVMPPFIPSDHLVASPHRRNRNGPRPKTETTGQDLDPQS